MDRLEVLGGANDSANRPERFDHGVIFGTRYLPSQGQSVNLYQQLDQVKLFFVRFFQELDHAFKFVETPFIISFFGHVFLTTSSRGE